MLAQLVIRHFKRDAKEDSDTIMPPKKGGKGGAKKGKGGKKSGSSKVNIHGIHSEDMSLP